MSGGDSGGGGGADSRSRDERGGQQNRDDHRDEARDGGRGPSTAETVLTAVSVAFTLLLFGYVAWQAVDAPGSTQPRVEVLGTERLADGSLLVRVEFTNTGDVGLVSATVEAECGRPPPDATFEHVPAGGTQRATLVCPPGTGTPDVTVSAWVPT